MLGVQYRANDDGQRQAPFFVADRDAAPWLFDGTGLENGTSWARRSEASGSRST